MVFLMIILVLIHFHSERYCVLVGVRLVFVVLPVGLCLWFFVFLDLAQGALVGHAVILFDSHCGLVAFINCFIGYVGFLIIVGRSLDFLLIVYLLRCCCLHHPRSFCFGLCGLRG